MAYFALLNAHCLDSSKAKNVYFCKHVFYMIYANCK